MVFKLQRPQHVADQSVGISLKAQHYADILNKKPSVPWFEVHPENLFSGTALRHVERIRADYPLSFHSVGLSLGSAEFNSEYLDVLEPLVTRLDPTLVSAHVAWNYSAGTYVDDLLPLPYTDESLAVLKGNIDKTQSILGRKVLIENPATHMPYAYTAYDECDFLIDIAQATGCGILLDINNLYVRFKNDNLDPTAYMRKVIQAEVVQEMHLAGHDVIDTDKGTQTFLDTHGGPVSDEVWALYKFAVSLGSRCIPTLVEWDQNVPTLDTLLQEQKKATFIQAQQYAPQRLAEKI